jgi:hypothetical protein
MAEGPGNGVIATTDEERALRELAASRRDLVASVTRQIDFEVTHLHLSVADANARVRSPLCYEPDAQPADQVSWSELSNLIERDVERGQALWQRLKNEAAEEYGTGMRTARALEPPVNGRPWDRARFAALLTALNGALAPRNPVEDLLVQQMAAMQEGWLRWQAIATQRTETDAWEGERDRRRALENMSPAQRERYEADNGWLPPRLGTAAAIEQAVLLADRYQRAFLRLLKAFRDNRRLFGALIVAGGQVNIGEQQVNVQQEQPQRSAAARSAPIRRTTRARVRNSGTGAQHLVP